jgi:spermidine dehydrogenase
MSNFTRRDFLDGVKLAAGTVLLSGASPLDLLAGAAEDWDGPSGAGDYAGANGDTYNVMQEGHRIRDGAYTRVPAAAIEDAGRFDCVVVGGGISGLAAALFFQRRTNSQCRCLVLENHSIFGGLAKENEFRFEGQRLIGQQASAMFFPPLEGSFLEGFYRSIGIDRMTFDYQEWAGKDPVMELGRTNYFEGGRRSAFFFGPKFGESFGILLIDPWGRRLEGAPIPGQARDELLRMHDNSGAFKKELPKEHGDAQARRLDGITLEQHLMEVYGISRETVRTYLSPISGGGSGIGADALSAYADYAADVLFPWQYDKGAQMFPGGNSGVARHIVKSLIPDAIPGLPTMANVARNSVDWNALDKPERNGAAIRSSCTVLSVQHEGSPEGAGTVAVTYSRNGKLYRVRASGVVIAGGSWTAKRIIKGLPASHQAAFEQFHRSPCLVVNVALRNWRFLYKLGIHEVRWFEGIGNSAAVRKMAAFGPGPARISPDSPAVLTLKILFSYPGKPIQQQQSRGRAELLRTPFRDYEARIREQLSMMFGNAGFHARRDMLGLILNRWGHAYLSPQPGFFFGSKPGEPAPGEVLRRNPVGRVAFANSDVTGIMDHRASIQEAKRAVDQIMERMS